MVQAQHPLPIGKQFLEQAQRLARLARLPGPVGDAAAGYERVRLVPAQYPL
jgi:hypothetical protein